MIWNPFKPKSEMDITFSDRASAQDWADKWNRDMFGGKKTFVVTSSKVKAFPYTVTKLNKVV